MRTRGSAFHVKNALALCFIGAVSVALPYSILTHVFRSGTPDDDEPEHNAWIMSKIGGNKFFNSLYSFGYWKASLRRFIADYKLLLFPQPQAVAGACVVDCQLVDLQGNELSLLRDIVEKCPPGVPLILNMGSYSECLLLPLRMP